MWGGARRVIEVVGQSHRALDELLLGIDDPVIEAERLQNHLAEAADRGAIALRENGHAHPERLEIRCAGIVRPAIEADIEVMIAFKVRHGARELHLLAAIAELFESREKRSRVASSPKGFWSSRSLLPGTRLRIFSQVSSSRLLKRMMRDIEPKVK